MFFSRAQARIKSQSAIAKTPNPLQGSNLPIRKPVSKIKNSVPAIVEIIKTCSRLVESY